MIVENFIFKTSTRIFIAPYETPHKTERSIGLVIFYMTKFNENEKLGSSSHSINRVGFNHRRSILNPYFSRSYIFSPLPTLQIPREWQEASQLRELICSRHLSLTFYAQSSKKWLASWSKKTPWVWKSYRIVCLILPLPLLLLLLLQRRRISRW